MLPVKFLVLGLFKPMCSCAKAFSTENPERALIEHIILITNNAMKVYAVVVTQFLLGAWGPNGATPLGLNYKSHKQKELPKVV